MFRTRLATVLLTAAASAAVVPAAAHAGNVSPGSGGQNTQFVVKAPAGPVKQAQDNGGFADVRFTGPRAGNCGQHHSPAVAIRAGKAVFNLKPQLTYAKKWCKGTYKFKVIVDLTGDGSSVRTIATGSFKIR